MMLSNLFHLLKLYIPGESDVAEVIIRESEAEEAAAKTFLEDVRLTFPEVDCVSALLQLLDYTTVNKITSVISNVLL